MRQIQALRLASLSRKLPNNENNALELTHRRDTFLRRIVGALRWSTLRAISKIVDRSHVESSFLVRDGQCAVDKEKTVISSCGFRVSDAFSLSFWNGEERRRSIFDFEEEVFG